MKRGTAIECREGKRCPRTTNVEDNAPSFRFLCNLMQMKTAAPSTTSEPIFSQGLPRAFGNSHDNAAM
jgi:hypothetical protein